MKITKIAITVGPSCQDAATLRELINEGADIIRINASHTTPDGLRRWIRSVRKVTSSLKKRVPIFVDLQGPRVRTGPLAGKAAVKLKKGQELSIKIGKGEGNVQEITTSCKPFLRMVSPGDPILIDNGHIELKVEGKKDGKVQTRVIVGGRLGENKGINLPNAPVTLDALTAKDKLDLQVCAEMKVSYVALSFVRSANDILAIKQYLKKLGANIPIIAKIEKPKAFREIDSILAVTDAVMVARGDLGIEMGLEKIPMVQKELIERANSMGIPIITATQMLESMMEQPRPSRAEVSDIANAALDGTDAVMLSGETAVGKYPIEAVRTMSGILKEVESHYFEKTPVLGSVSDRYTPESYAITHAAFHACRELGAKAIVTFTFSGKTPILISKMKPNVPILALCPSEETCLRLSLLRGVMPFKIDYSKSTDEMIRKADKLIMAEKILKKGDSVVLVSGKAALPAALYMAKIHQVGAI